MKPTSHKILRAIVVLCAATVMAAVFLLQSYFIYTNGQQAFPWNQQILQAVTSWFLWAAFSPLIFAFAYKFRFEPGSVLKSLLFHTAAGAVVALMHATIQIPLTDWLVRTESEFRLIPGILSGQLVPTLLWRFFVYAAVLIICIALDSHRKALEAEFRTSRIETGILQASMEMLKMHIDPDFLFSSLKRLSRLMERDLDEADTLIARLGDYLRIMLDNSKTAEVTLREEIESVACYLEIDHGTKASFDIASDALNWKIPGMILLAPVEDALRRKANEACLELKITARIEDTMLILSVLDPGLQYSPAKTPRFSSLLERLNSYYGPGITTSQSWNENAHLLRISIPPTLKKRCGEESAEWIPPQEDSQMEYGEDFQPAPDLKWPAILGAFTFLALFFTVQSMVLQANRGQAMNWSLQMINCTGWYLWALITPLVFKLSSRFPIRRANLLKHLAIHTAATTVAWFLACLALGLLEWTVSQSRDSLLNSIVASFRRYPLYLDLICYAAIVAVERAARYHRRTESGNLRAARLGAQLARARLSALRMQLHPHFLFNTLNSLSELMQEDPKAAREMIVNLEKFLSITLTTPQAQQIPFEKELDFLRCYLAIEGIRFANRLKVRMDIEQQALKVSVPNLLLQPIVENAIKHGVAPRTSPGEIEILAKRNNGMLEVSVRDNGPGFNRHKRNSMPDRQGLGLANTRERLMQIYGQSHRFELANAPEGGLVVTVEIPVDVRQV